MIVAQANRTMQALERAEELKKIQSERDHLLATLEELRRVEQALSELIAVHATVQDCLTDEMRLEYRRRSRELVEAFRASHQQFQTERRQVDSLRGIRKKIKGLRNHLGRAWYVAVHPQLDQYVTLVELVRSLPEVQEELSSIDCLIQQLRELLNEAPSNSRMRREFEYGIETLAGHLSSIGGLNDQVQEFLTKVAAGQATLADVDEEILGWCQREGRASIFMVSFRNL